MRKLLSRLLLALVLCIGLAPIKAFATPGEEGQVEKQSLAIIRHKVQMLMP